MKRFVSALLILSIAFTGIFVFPSKSAAEEEIDYKALTARLRMNYKKDFQTPTPRFNVYVNGEHKELAKPNGGMYENMEDIPVAFTCKTGDNIKVSDESDTGSGTSIIKRDWQVGMAHDGSGYTGGYHSYSSSAVSFKADKPGMYTVFLNVADNYDDIPNFQNWSENGNWRTEVIPSSYRYPGVTIRGWYFTCYKFEVLGEENLEADFDILYQGQNKTDGKIKPEKFPFDLSLKDKSKGSSEITSWEWYVYNWDKGSNDKFGTIQNPSNPSMQITEDSKYVSAGGGEILYTLKVKDTKGNTGQAQHSVTIEKETSIEVKASIDAPAFADNPEDKEVYGTFIFSAASQLYDLKSYQITEGAEYINGSTSGDLSGKKDSRNLSMMIPVDKQIKVKVRCFDTKGNYSDGTASCRVSPYHHPPYTSIRVPGTVYPRVATQTGEYENVLKWNYISSDGLEMVHTEYVLYKNVAEEGEEEDWKEIASDSIPTGGMTEKEKEKARSVTVEGDPGEEFRLDVVVIDSLGSPGTDSDEFEIDVPDPDFELNVPEYQYIRETVETGTEDNTEGYPNKFFPITFTQWSITENDTGRMVKQGTGKITDKVYTEWEVTPKGEKLNGGFYEGKYYTFKQTAKNVFGEITKEKHLYIVPVPDPQAWVTEVYTLINEKVSTESSVIQPPVPNYINYGLPAYTCDFDESNSNFKIYKPDGTLLLSGKGIFKNFEVNRNKGFKDSTEENVTYKIEQYAENTKGKFSRFATDLVILQTPKPTVNLVTKDTYINENIEVKNEISEIENIKKRPKNYKDFQEIYDNFKTGYNSSNTNWKIEEIDYFTGQVTKLIEKGTGQKKMINVYEPKYEENKMYLLTQYAVNKKGITGSNSSIFAVLIPPPPMVTIEINERDDDPMTLKNEIYTKENLDISTSVKDDKFQVTETWWEVKNKSGNIVKNGMGQINRLIKMDLPIGEYSVWQYARNSKNKVGSAYTTFKIKPVLAPMIEVTETNLLIHSKDNILFMGDPLMIKVDVKDINRSEEHPKGYDLKNTYAVRDRYTNTVLKEEGTADINLVINRPDFKQGEEYIFRQYAQNAEFSNIANTFEMYFNVGNKKPTVKLDITEGTGQPPLFTEEEIKIDVNAYDTDGYINKVEYYINNINRKETSSFKLKSFTEDGMGTNHYTAKLVYTGTKKEDISFKVAAYDDFGDKGTAESPFYISVPAINTVVEIENENKIQLKENRYVEFTLKNSYTNAKTYPLDFSGSEIQYQKDSGEWTDISKNINFEDGNIRIYYPNYPDKKTVSSYFKQKGSYKLRAKVPNTRGEKGEWGYKEFTITEDLPPKPDFTIISPYRRISEEYIELNKDISSVVKEENINKSFFVFEDKSVSPDGDILGFKTIETVYDPLDKGIKEGIKDVTSIVEDEEKGLNKDEEIVKPIDTSYCRVKDIDDYKLTFLTDENELGDYYFTFTVLEDITQLPSETNPLYTEIKNLRKKSISEPFKISVDNVAPVIRIEVTGSESINLIIHYDDTPDFEEENKIKEIIQNLENKGIKVNVIKEYNRY